MSLTGKILISHPNVPDGNIFHRSVVYLYQDNPSEGSIGLILNKPSKFLVQDAARDKNIILPDLHNKIYHGGPVNQQALVMLHTNNWGSENTMPAGRQLCVSSDNLMFHKLANGDHPAYWRMFGGMAGWAPGQLDAELSGKWPYRAENSWLIAEPTEEFLFMKNGEKQWQRAFELSSNQMFNQYF